MQNPLVAVPYGVRIGHHWRNLQVTASPDLQLVLQDGIRVKGKGNKVGRGQGDGTRDPSVQVWTAVNVPDPQSMLFKN